MTLNKGLVGYWTMDTNDISSGTVYDSSAYDNHGETRGGLTTGTAGRVGEAVTFNGTDGYIPTRLFYETTQLSQVSVSHWYNSSVYSQQVTVASDRNEYYRVGVKSDGVDGVLWTVSSSDIVSNTSASALQDGNWHHIVCVFDATVTNDHKIYVDGQLDKEVNVYSSGIGNGNVSYTMIGVGSEASVFDGVLAPTDYIDGKLDDVRIYNRPLSAEEVNQLYQIRTQRAQYNSLAKGLILRYIAGADSITSDTLLDVTPYNADAGTATLSTQTGNFDTALDVDGNAVSFDHQPFRDAVTDAEYSITLWIKQDDQADALDFRDVIEWNDGTTKQSQKRLERSNADFSTNQDYWVNFGMNPDHPKGALNSRDIGVSSNEWWHFAATVSDSNNEFNIYVNGQLDGTSGVDTAEIADPGQITLAPSEYGGGIEDLRFYRRPLSAEEVNRLYQQQELQ